MSVEIQECPQYGYTLYIGHTGNPKWPTFILACVWQTNRGHWDCRCKDKKHKHR